MVYPMKNICVLCIFYILCILMYLLFFQIKILDNLIRSWENIRDDDNDVDDDDDDDDWVSKPSHTINACVLSNHAKFHTNPT